jgi:hypothetical protein
MAGQKLSAKVSETVEFLDYVLIQCDHLAHAVEEYASAKKPAQIEWVRQQISRDLGHLRQRAMVKNLGVLADEAGRLSVAASAGGSQMMKTRILRDGVSALKAAVERFRKAKVDADVVEQKKKKATEGEGE